MFQPKPIETHYNGYRFRSRVEARWAVFFDTLRLPFAYEHEGYDLDGVWYLPDFWLATLHNWIEIKGDFPDELELEKAQRLCQVTGHDVFVFVGEPWYESKAAAVYRRIDQGRINAASRLSYRWLECTTRCASAARCGAPCLDICVQPGPEDPGDPASQRLMAAYTAARSARFGR